MVSVPWAYATKVAIGNVVCALFVFIPTMSFQSSGLICTLYIIAATLVAETSHIGSHMLAAYLLLWSGIYGSILATTVLLLHVGNLGIILLSLLVVYPPLILLRFSSNPK